MQVGGFADWLAAAADVADCAGGGADYQMEIWDAFCYQRTHADHGETSDGEVVADGALRTDGGAFADQGGECVLVGIGGAELFQIWSCGAGKAIIGESGAGADHYSIFDGDGGADVDHGVDFDTMADFYVVGDVGFFSDDALLADLSAVADVDTVPDGTAGADCYVVFNDGCGVNADVGKFFGQVGVS